MKRIFTQPYSSIHDTPLWVKVSLTSEARCPISYSDSVTSSREVSLLERICQLIHHHASLLKIINKTGSLFRGLGALRHFLSLSLSALSSGTVCLYSPTRFLRPVSFAYVSWVPTCLYSLPLQLFSLAFAPTPLPCSLSLFCFLVVIAISMVSNSSRLCRWISA